jgi:hypothetical protein
MAMPSSSFSSEPQQLTDNAQLVGDQQIGTTGIFEQESITVGQYNYISSGTTTVVKSGPGTFIGLIIGNTTSGTITVYDNTAGSGNTIIKFNASTTPFSFPVGAKFTTGLTVVTTASDQVTIIYV